MTIEQLRNLIADDRAAIGQHSEFIRQLRSGEQDDGIMMHIAKVVNDAWLAQVQPAPESVED